MTVPPLAEVQGFDERCALVPFDETGEIVSSTPTLWLRRAELDDVDTLLEWRVETAEKLRIRYGTDQWSAPYPRWKLEQWVRRGSMWMALLEPDAAPRSHRSRLDIREPLFRSASRWARKLPPSWRDWLMPRLIRLAGTAPIATITVDPEPEPDTHFWTAQELEIPAWFLSKLNRSPVEELDGLNIGQALLDWALTQASLAGVVDLRFDCWTTNERLRAWYENQGAELVRVVDGVNSGACYRLASRVIDTPVRVMPGSVPPADRAGMEAAKAT